MFTQLNKYIFVELLIEKVVFKNWLKFEWKSLFNTKLFQRIIHVVKHAINYPYSSVFSHGNVEIHMHKNRFICIFCIFYLIFPQVQTVCLYDLI